MKVFLKILPVLVIAVPVAFVLLPVRFEVLAGLLFCGLLLLVVVDDSVRSEHRQHPPDSGRRGGPLGPAA